MGLRADAAKNRQQIIETAYRLFKSGGFHATGIDKIIAEAGVAKMTMYRHFPSKEALIIEVLNWRAGCFNQQLDQLAGVPTTPEATVEAILDWHERWFDSQEFRGCTFQHALGEFGDPAHPVFEAAACQKLGVQRRLREILARSLPEDRAGQIATALFMLIEGATVLAHMGQAKMAISTARAAAAGILASMGTLR